MKILFITDLYPINAQEKTTPKTLHNFVFEWIKQGHSVEVIKPNFIFNSFLRGKTFYKEGFYKYEGVKIFNVNYFTPFFFDFSKKLPNELNLQNYDVIIAHMPSGIILGSKLAQKLSKPIVCAVHNSDIEILTNPIYSIYFKQQLKDAYKIASKIACRSFVLQKKFCALMPELADKTFVAPSGVEIGKKKTGNGKWEDNAIVSLRGESEANDEAIQIRAKGEYETGNRKPLTIPHSPLTIITCANFIKRKNIDKLILAMKDLEGFKLKIIGDGKELKNLKKLAVSLQEGNKYFKPLLKPFMSLRGGREANDEAIQKTEDWNKMENKDANDNALLSLRGANEESNEAIQNKITFLGRLTHEQVLKEMQKSDIFILPSVNETFGMVYLEAMASGCITVCTKGDGIDGIIKDGENGFLCEPTVKGIKETLLKIKTLCGAQSAPCNLKQILANSHETIKHYTPQECAKNYLNNINI